MSLINHCQWTKVALFSMMSSITSMTTLLVSGWFVNGLGYLNCHLTTMLSWHLLALDFRHLLGHLSWHISAALSWHLLTDLLGNLLRYLSASLILDALLLWDFFWDLNRFLGAMLPRHSLAALLWHLVAFLFWHRGIFRGAFLSWHLGARLSWHLL